MNKICVLCHAINAELATVCHYCGAALGEAPHEGAAMRERTRELEDEKLRYQQSCYGRAAFFMEELNALRIELEAERSRREAAEQARNIYADAKDGMAECGTKQQLRADSLAKRVTELTEQLNAYAVQYGNAALSQPKPASKEKEK